MSIILLALYVNIFFIVVLYTMKTSVIYRKYIEHKLKGLSGESLHRASILCNSIAITFAFSLLYIPVTFITGFVVARYTMFFSTVLMIVLFLSLRGFTLRIIAPLFILSVWLMTLVLIYYSGGMVSLVLPWLMLVPILSLVLLSKEWQLVLLGISVLSPFIFFIVPEPHWNWVYISPWPVIYNSTLFVVLTLMVYLLVKAFKLQQHSLLAQSEKQNDGLRATKEELRLSMEELSATRDILSEQNLLITDRQKKTNNYLLMLIDLTTCKGILEGNLQAAYSQILSSTSQALGSRISIWRHNDIGRYIECVGLFDVVETNLIAGIKLYESDYAPYFKAVLSKSIIDAADAQIHEATSCFTESYLKPLDIYSLLDVPYYENGKFEGVICCEHQHSVRVWDQEDIIFVKSVADLLSMAMDSSLRKQAEMEIALQRKKIIKQHEELIQYAADISAINESLESKVQERTSVLNEQNQKLTEYAFVNAHLLRGPLCRIMGLSELIKIEKCADEIPKMAIMLDYSVKELDDVVQKITTILYQGRILDRDSIKK